MIELKTLIKKKKERVKNVKKGKRRTSEVFAIEMRFIEPGCQFLPIKLMNIPLSHFFVFYSSKFCHVFVRLLELSF